MDTTTTPSVTLDDGCVYVRGREERRERICQITFPSLSALLLTCTHLPTQASSPLPLFGSLGLEGVLDGLKDLNLNLGSLTFSLGGT